MAGIASISPSNQSAREQKNYDLQDEHSEMASVSSRSESSYESTDDYSSIKSGAADEHQSRTDLSHRSVVRLASTVHPDHNQDQDSRRANIKTIYEKIFFPICEEAFTK